MLGWHVSNNIFFAYLLMALDRLPRTGQIFFHLKINLNKTEEVLKHLQSDFSFVLKVT